MTSSVDAGARLVAGGTYDGLFYRPTVLDEVREGIPAYAQEVFGPVAPVIRFGSLAEAARLAADSGYGLSLGILTKDVMKGLELAEQIPTGIVHINDQTVNDEAVAPFGGVLDSGTGARFGGTANLDAFTDQRWITIRGTSPRTRSNGAPMTARTTPPFRADHVGSLLRPAAVLRAREERANGTISADELRAVEDDAIRDAVAMQRDLGLRSATDGEFRRTSWHMDFIYALGGVSQADGSIRVRMHNPAGDVEFTAPAMQVNGPIRLPEPIFASDYMFLRSTVDPSVTAKLTIPSPSMVHYRGGPAAIDRAVYPDDDAFWADLSAAYAAQIQAMADLGCTYLQLDDTSLAYLNDPAQRAELDARGDDAEHQHLRYIRQINAALADRPAGLSVTTHMCRGNFRSSWAASGSYDFVAEALFSELAVDGFFLEYDDERSGSFAPLRFVPPGKMVVLGLVTTKRGELESKDDLKRRIDEAAAYVPLEQLCLSPQCGFSSTVEGNALSYDEQVAKLALVVETAAEVWG